MTMDENLNHRRMLYDIQSKPFVDWTSLEKEMYTNHQSIGHTINLLIADRIARIVRRNAIRIAENEAAESKYKSISPLIN